MRYAVKYRKVKARLSSSLDEWWFIYFFTSTVLSLREYFVKPIHCKNIYIYEKLEKWCHNFTYKILSTFPRKPQSITKATFCLKYWDCACNRIFVFGYGSDNGQNGSATNWIKEKVMLSFRVVYYYYYY